MYLPALGHLFNRVPAPDNPMLPFPALPRSLVCTSSHVGPAAQHA